MVQKNQIPTMSVQWHKSLKIEKFTNAINKASILQLQELLKNMLSNNVVKTEEKN